MEHDILIRLYDPDLDSAATQRIWRETGWLRDGSEEGMDCFVRAGRTHVAELNGEAECLVTQSPGRIRYQQEELPFWCICGVTTGRIARRQGLARRVTAHGLALAAAEGALVAGLGMFEQGYYDQLGFGTGGYERIVAFDPARLRMSGRPRVPRRLKTDDWEAVHASRCARLRDHGSCNLDAPLHTRGEMLMQKSSFGLGYFDGPSGELTHHFWCHVEDPGRGPYRLAWMAYQTREQFLELMGLVRGLGDQVRLVRLVEPPNIQFQDLIDQPFMQRYVTKQSRLESGVRAIAYWQMRVCDLPACMERTHLQGGNVRFNLELSDPVARYLGEDAPWRGVAGDYVVTLGATSSAEPGRAVGLPTLTATVNAFTRLWLGVRPASGLAMTDDLRGPTDLLRHLDDVLLMPEPRPDWDF